jgi:hypothetical protein
LINKLKIKKFINNLLENSARKKSLINKHSESQKPVLILGTGLSSLYIQDIIHKYEFIIITNNLLLNKKLRNISPLYWVIMEPNFLTKLQIIERDLWKILREDFNSYKNTIPIMHPIGRIFNYGLWKDTNPLFLSPYYKLNLNSGDTYDNFRGSFSTCLGMALLSGFKDIHFSGFDAMLLTPKNNLRWYSKYTNPNDFDIMTKEEVPDFLKIASNNAKISVYSYRHYKPKYDFLSEIKIRHDNIYIPGRDRHKYIDPETLKVWQKLEQINPLRGYD